MNNPNSMQNSDFNNKLLCCCWLVQRMLKQELGKGKKEHPNLERGGEYSQKETSNRNLPVIDATAKSIQITLDDNGIISRENNTKSKQIPEDIKTIKHIQDIANQEKLQTKRKDEDQRDI